MLLSTHGLVGSACLLTLACGGALASSPGRDGGVDEGLADAAAPGCDAFADVTDAPITCTSVASTCGQLRSCANPVGLVLDPCSAPTATGGSVLPGTYALTSSTVFVGPGGGTGTSGSPVSDTIQLTATDAAQSFDWTGVIVMGGPPIASTGTLTFSAPDSFGLQVSCTSGSAASTSGTYSADATSITFYFVDGGTSGVSAARYTKL